MRRVVVAVAAAYAAFTLLALALHGGDPFWFVWIGERWADGVLTGRSGYDGQFVYYIARDGWAAAPRLDQPGYRFGRVLAPALARLLSGGDPAGLPWAMLAINYAAVVAGSAALAGWLARHHTSPWWALSYAFGVGLLFAYSRDTTEPLAYGLAAAGLIAWLDGRRAGALLLLAFAGLARETTLLCLVGLGAAALAAGQRRALAALALAAVPTLAWHAYLAAALPSPALGVVTRLVPLPLGGAWPLADCEPGRLGALLFAGLPALALLPGAVAWVVRQPAAPLAWLIALHALLTLALPQETYLHLLGVARVSLGLVVALVLAMPWLSGGLRALIAALCVGPTLLWLPVILSWAPWTAAR